LTTHTQIETLWAAHRQSWRTVNPNRLRYVRRYAKCCVLDLGCAKGDYVQYLSARNYKAYGLDLLVYDEWIQAEEQPYAVGNATRLPYADKSFDTVMAFELLEHLPDPAYALHEIHRVCKENLIVTVPNCETARDLVRAGLTYVHWTDRTHCNFFTQESLASVLERASFQHEVMTRINPVLSSFPFLRSVHIPFHLASLVSRLLRRIPFTKRYYMTLLAVANI
jgi:SAM-dependent methyltransferase